MPSADFDPKTRFEKRQLPPALQRLLEYDVKATKAFVSFLLNFIAVKSLKSHCKFLEVSCHGIVWLAGWLAFCWIIDNKDLYQMQINMMFGLILDILFVALIKAATRRRRPCVDDFFTIGPDKFSFPSGHTSRAFYLLCFFTWLYPVSWIFWPPLFAWAFSVAISRLLIYRHHLLDVIAGMLLGCLESILLCILWLGPKFTNYLMNALSEDNVPGGPEAA